VGHLHRHRPDLLRAEDAEAAALDHGGSAHADVRVGGGDDHVAAAQDGGVAREAAAGVDSHHGHQAAEPSEPVPGEDAHAAAATHPLRGAARACGGPAAAARTATAALGEDH